MNVSTIPESTQPDSTLPASITADSTQGESAGADPLPVDPGRPTADIIPFPLRPKPPEPRPEERLARAMETLHAALAEQRTALAGWREALGQLKTTATGLGESLQRYRSSLGALSGRVSVLHDQARSLEKWADTIPND